MFDLIHYQLQAQSRNRPLCAAERPSISGTLRIRTRRAVLTSTVEKHLKIHKSALEACKNAEAIVICTEWDEFKTLDWQESECFPFSLYRYQVRVLAFDEATDDLKADSK